MKVGKKSIYRLCALNFSIKLMYSLSFSRWFCHFDDDNYVNVPRLVKLLDEYSPTVDWYLGKPSISSPLEIHLDSVSAKQSYKLRSFLLLCVVSSFFSPFCIFFQYSLGNYTSSVDRSLSVARRRSPFSVGTKLLALFMRPTAPGHLSMPPFGFQLPA